MADFDSVLGELSAERFLSEYWQQQPRLFRSAFTDFVSPVSADELAGLALEDEVESRLIQEHGDSGPWQVRNGPLQASTFAQLPATGWTLLVQAADLWVPELKALYQSFDFIPRWRFDDIMVSYAPAGGSAGPHFDQYDVFLLQVEGQRRWQIGGVCDESTPVMADTPLCILQDFEPQEEWLLEPGDMLYLPPGIAHWGIAESECMTYSIGFRSPSVGDMLGDLAIEILAQGNGGHDYHYRDPPLTPGMAGDLIHPDFIDQIRGQLRQVIDDRALLEDWFARFMTAPRYPGLEELTGEERTATTSRASYRNGELDG
jgi:50S ribosomal protein L16 3-hydroxylase